MIEVLNFVQILTRDQPFLLEFVLVCMFLQSQFVDRLL